MSILDCCFLSFLFSHLLGIFQIICICIRLLWEFIYNLFLIYFFRSTVDSNVLLVNDFQDRLQVCNRLMLLVYLPVVAFGVGD